MSPWRRALLHRAGSRLPDANQTDAFRAAGLEQLARHIQRLADYPTVAIGGISLEKAPVLATGVGSIAVVSAITQAADWRAATDQLLALAGAGDE
jgi:thiamine-phosphate pyrophosphorylase